ncbi:transcriptional repressor TraM [Rhizobium multihospitium]|uniref:Transcriptional repressor TraM n=1 Tax=Rhizobium multihospitium TaxID=410764 RepID=A0A1C3XBI1_9HYPH|nr:transcriptional repressor TraM [Rhizobium multihospitium]SCB49598.1 Transcriptional repressor TraM [Rhizobium multihospitium]
MTAENSSEKRTESIKGKPRYDALSKPELEVLAVYAIREHRRLLEADQAVYDEWTRIAADPLSSETVLKNLQDEYIARQKRSEAQQDELSDIIDALGYVPIVPVDIDE